MNSRIYVTLATTQKPWNLNSERLLITRALSHAHVTIKETLKKKTDPQCRLKKTPRFRLRVITQIDRIKTVKNMLLNSIDYKDF